ncbi:MAG: SRPBCC family protein [Spirochaetales bacterium]|nr:SRPBCC family protein [Spirochaetales bacterium]
MKIAPGKIAPAVVAVLAVIILALPSVLPDSYRAAHEEQIAVPLDRVYSHLNNLKNWNEWTQMHAGAEGLEFFYPLTLEGQGSIMQWVGETTSGQLVFEAVEKNKKIEYNVYIDRDRDSKGSIALEESTGGTVVRWEVSGKLPYFRRYVGLFYGSTIKGQMESALLRLKQLLEK